jgi:hypothetical protein
MESMEGSGCWWVGGEAGVRRESKWSAARQRAQSPSTELEVREVPQRGQEGEVFMP